MQKGPDNVLIIFATWLQLTDSWIQFEISNYSAVVILLFYNIITSSI